MWAQNQGPSSADVLPKLSSAPVGEFRRARREPRLTIWESRRFDTSVSEASQVMSEKGRNPLLRIEHSCFCLSVGLRLIMGHTASVYEQMPQQAFECKRASDSLSRRTLGWKSSGNAFGEHAKHAAHALHNLRRCWPPPAEHTSGPPGQPRRSCRIAQAGPRAVSSNLCPWRQVRKALARSNGAQHDQSLAATPLGPTQDNQQASQQHLQTKPVYHVQGHGQRRTAQTVPINGSTSTFLSLI